MELDEKSEEILETLWIETQEQKAEAVPLENLGADQKEAADQLVRTGCITISNDMVQLSKKGLPLAADVIRRHRLAERLLIDVLFTSDALLDYRACKFEHLLDRGVTANICSLLGHPKVCPHGKPIPPGECCREDRSKLQKVVSTLSQMTTGTSGKIAYVHAPQAAKLQKLMSMGILPGAPIQLVQRFPSYVFQVRQEQFAVDKEIADSIFVRIVEAETVRSETQHRQEKRPMWQRFRYGQRRRGKDGKPARSND